MLVVSENLITKYYLSEKAEEKRAVGTINSFQNYVTENSISSDDTEMIGNWTRTRGNVNLVIYNSDGKPYVRAGRWGESYIDQGNWDNTTERKSHEVQFSNGAFPVVISFLNQLFIWQATELLSLILAFLLFIVILLIYNQRMIKALITLRSEANSVAEGDFNHTITIKGHGEIADLAADVDKMRTSIITGMEIEQSAIKANSDLITSISHDIRTPLTALIGYLDMIKAHQYTSAEYLEQYTNTALEKAMQIKDLTDELFGYFLVFGQNSTNLVIEEYDGVILLQQLLGEHIVSLETSGFNVISQPLNEQFTFRVDVASLKRVYDNLFINIEKYADRTREIIITGKRTADSHIVSLTNYIPKTAVRREGTQIGIKTCEKLLSQMGGSLEITRSGDKFSAEVILPAVFKRQENSQSGI